MLHKIPTCCMVCGQNKESGIHILDEFLCEACEGEIVKTDVGEQRYTFFVTQLRQLHQRINV